MGNQTEYQLWYHAKDRAKLYNLDFDIEVEDIVIPMVCPILNIPVYKGKGKVHDGSPSLDRINPELGYVKGNVCVISYKANRYKNNMTTDIVKRLYKYMTETH